MFTNKLPILLRYVTVALSEVKYSKIAVLKSTGAQVANSHDKRHECLLLVHRANPPFPTKTDDAIQRL